MTQQTALLRRLWREPRPEGHRFRAVIKDERYNRDEGRSFWLLINPCLAANNNVVATHTWVPQDQTMVYLPPMGAVISFNAEVKPYTRTNGMSGFGLSNLHNVVIESDTPTSLELDDYDDSEAELADEPMDFATMPMSAADVDALLANLDPTALASSWLEQNIASEAEQRTEKLAQRLQLNQRLASLARELEEVTSQFLKNWQQAQAATVELTQLEAELTADPDWATERTALQQLANHQRQLAETYWCWAPPLPVEEPALPAASVATDNLAPSSIPSAVSVTQPAEQLAEPAINTPPVPIDAAISEAARIKEEEESQAALRDMIASMLTPLSIAVTPPPTHKSKADKKQKSKPTPPPELVVVAEAAAADAIAANEAITSLAGEEIDVATIEPTTEEDESHRAAKLSREIRTWKEQVVDQVWRLVQRKQPTRNKQAPYTLAEIKDGRHRDTDHLKRLGLKIILELLALIDERPTRKELARYLSYDLPQSWSLAKLSQEPLRQEVEHLREDIVSELRATMPSAA